MMLLRTEPAGGTEPVEPTSNPLCVSQPEQAPYSSVLFSIVGESTSGPLPFSKRTTSLAAAQEPPRRRLLVTMDALSRSRSAECVLELDVPLGHDGPSITLASSVGEAPSTSTPIPWPGLRWCSYTFPVVMVFPARRAHPPARQRSP